MRINGGGHISQLNLEKNEGEGANSREKTGEKGRGDPADGKRGEYATNIGSFSTQSLSFLIQRLYCFSPVTQFSKN